MKYVSNCKILLFFFYTRPYELTDSGRINNGSSWWLSLPISHESSAATVFLERRPNPSLSLTELFRRSNAIFAMTVLLLCSESRRQLIRQIFVPLLTVNLSGANRDARISRSDACANRRLRDSLDPAAVAMAHSDNLKTAGVDTSASIGLKENIARFNDEYCP